MNYRLRTISPPSPSAPSAPSATSAALSALGRRAALWLVRSRLLLDLAHLDNARSMSIGRFLVKRDLDAELPQVRRDSTQVIAEEGWIARPGCPFRDLRLGTIAISELEQQFGCRSMPRAAALDHEGMDRSGDAIVFDQKSRWFPPHLASNAHKKVPSAAKAPSHATERITKSAIRGSRFRRGRTRGSSRKPCTRISSIAPNIWGRSASKSFQNSASERHPRLIGARF